MYRSKFFVGQNTTKIPFRHLTNFIIHVKQNHPVFYKEQTDYWANGIGTNRLGNLFRKAITHRCRSRYYR